MSDDPVPLSAPAQLGWRIGARVVDGVVLLWVAAFLLIEIDGRVLGGDVLGRRPRPLDLSSARTAVILLVTSYTYEVLPVIWRGASLGKAMFGLRVVDFDAGDRPGALNASLRWLVLFGLPIVAPVAGAVVVALVVAPAFVMVSGRGLHDMLAGTRVDQLPRAEPTS